MKYAIASDIHGSATWCRRFLEDAEKRGVDGFILLGDLMYHGPRNPLPDGYDPAEVARMLNEHADIIIAVRGNCDSEVDQMLLDFPCLGDYAVVMDNGAQLFCTHGHLDVSGLDFSQTFAEGGSLLIKGSGLPDESFVLSGHTHVKVDEMAFLIEDSAPKKEMRHINPGSVGLPKDGSHSYAIYEDGEVEFVELH